MRVLSSLSSPRSQSTLYSYLNVDRRMFLLPHLELMLLHHSVQMWLALITTVDCTGEMIPLSVLVVPKIAAPLQCITSSKLQNLPYLRDLILAHPIMKRDIQLDIPLLIGVDYYRKIVEDNIVRGDGPTAVQSKLGYLLSGTLMRTYDQIIKEQERSGFVERVRAQHHSWEMAKHATYHTIMSERNPVPHLYMQCMIAAVKCPTIIQV